MRARRWLVWEGFPLYKGRVVRIMITRGIVVAVGVVEGGDGGVLVRCAREG